MIVLLFHPDVYLCSIYELTVVHVMVMHVPDLYINSIIHILKCMQLYVVLACSFLNLLSILK